MTSFLPIRGSGTTKALAAFLTTVLVAVLLLGGTAAASARESDPADPGSVSASPDGTGAPEDTAPPEGVGTSQEEPDDTPLPEPGETDADRDPDAPVGDDSDTTVPISPLALIPMGFGKGASFTTSDKPQGTVLGHAGVPTDLGIANQHFVYFPIPSKTETTTYETDLQETISMSRYIDGNAGDFGLAINDLGKVYAWGGNLYGQLGQGFANEVTGTSARLVSSLPSDLTFVQVSAAADNALALSSTGDIYTWGRNTSGQLALGHSNPNPSVTNGGYPNARKVSIMDGGAEVKFTQVSGGDQYTLAVSTTGDVWAWGKPTAGNVGGAGGTPRKLAGLSNIKMVSAGFNHAGAVTMTGDLYMWGYRFNGQIGNGTSAASSIGPTLIPRPSGTRWKQVSAGWTSTWAVASDGRLFAWGNNMNLQLGVGTSTANQLRPVHVASNVTQVSGNEYTAIAVLANGQVSVAGSNLRGQLGRAGQTPNSGFAPVTGVSGASEATVGRNAIAARGTLTQGWGSGAQTGRGQSFATPGNINGLGSGLPSQLSVGTVTTKTLTDAEARGSSISFGDPATTQSLTGWQMARNIDVVTFGGVRYLRGDVPPHAAGRTGVFVKWNWPSQVNPWEQTDGSYLYTIALKIDSTPRPGRTTQTVDVTTTFFDPAEAPYAGVSTVDFGIPALAGTPRSLSPAAGSPSTNISFAGGVATTRVNLVTPHPLANNGPRRWKYDASADAFVAGTSVRRNVPAGTIEFIDPTFPVYLWKTGESTSGQIVGMSGSSFAVYAESATSPGRPDKTSPVVAFSDEVPNPNASGTRRNGWFSADLATGTYWLFETRAPAGFELLAAPVQFTVRADGVVTLGIGGNSNTTVTGDWARSSARNTIVVQDPGKISLPEAGSAPIWWFTVLGMLLLFAALLLGVLFLARRRREVPAIES